MLETENVSSAATVTVVLAIVAGVAASVGILLKQCDFMAIPELSRPI